MSREQVFTWFFAIPVGVLLWMFVVIFAGVVISAAVDTWRGK